MKKFTKDYVQKLLKKIGSGSSSKPHSHTQPTRTPASDRTPPDPDGELQITMVNEPDEMNVDDSGLVVAHLGGGDAMSEDDDDDDGGGMENSPPEASTSTSASTVVGGWDPDLEKLPQRTVMSS